ncbi:MAG: Asp23/Gls24 family envelope stress response protein [Pyramidobacter sp.]|nr:Asp23/Gls24 family envelope stress response protein [Pyramidobacter sp.]
MTLMDDMQQNLGAASKSDFDLESAVAEAQQEENESSDGKLHISEDVILEIARRALAKLPSIQPASSGISSVLGIGRKNPEGVRVSLEEGANAQISVDAYVLIRYGLRIPDAAWDVQEFLKKELENSTGYEVKSVNIHVQGVYFEDAHNEEADVSDTQAKAALTTAAQ